MSQIETPLDFLRKDVRKMKPLSVVCAVAAFAGFTMSIGFIHAADYHYKFATWTNFPWIWQILQAAFPLSATLAVAIEKSRFKKLASFFGIGIIASNIVGVAVAIYLKRTIAVANKGAFIGEFAFLMIFVLGARFWYRRKAKLEGAINVD